MKNISLPMHRKGHDGKSVVLFLLPSAILLALFVFWPLVQSFQLSFYDWNPLKEAKFIGWNNYINLFSDKLWWTSVNNTLYYIILNVPGIILLALTMGLLVEKMKCGAQFFKSVYFSPTLVSLVATGIVWEWLLGTNNGMINGLLARLGLAPVKWFSSSSMAMVSIVIVTIWRWAGYYMVIIMAGLSGISSHYYEVTRLEGANGWQTFWYVTMPFLYPVIFFITLMSMIGSFQEFDLFYMITLGGPEKSTYVTGFLMRQTAFSNMKMGYASTMSTILFIIILVVTVIQNRISRNLLKGYT